MGKRGKKRYIFSSSIYLGLLCSLICVTSPEVVGAAAADPNFYYYSSGRKIPLVLSKKMLAVRFKQRLTIEEQKALNRTGNYNIIL